MALFIQVLIIPKFHCWFISESKGLILTTHSIPGEACGDPEEDLKAPKTKQTKGHHVTKKRDVTDNKIKTVPSDTN